MRSAYHPQTDLNAQKLQVIYNIKYNKKERKSVSLLTFFKYILKKLFSVIDALHQNR